MLKAAERDPLDPRTKLILDAFEPDNPAARQVLAAFKSGYWDAPVTAHARQKFADYELRMRRPGPLGTGGF